MIGPALHTISKAGRELLVRIAEAQAAGTPLLESAIDRRHAATISELIAFQHRTRDNGSRAVIDEVIVVPEAAPYLAMLGHPHLSRALKPPPEPEGAP